MIVVNNVIKYLGISHLPYKTLMRINDRLKSL